jgi:hypothetical protein
MSNENVTKVEKAVHALMKIRDGNLGKRMVKLKARLIKMVVVAVRISKDSEVVKGSGMKEETLIVNLDQRRG